jgi:Flp pilus assembly pilin Flp
MIDRANVLLVTLFVDGLTSVRDRLRREEGQAFVEYAMVLLLVTVVLAAGAFIQPFQDALQKAFESIGNAITKAIPN